MFRLIDSFLPFEACLYHQFLPMALEGKHLKLGMVKPEDSAARGYVRHILAYLNCSLKTELIDTQTHQSLLSEYLNYTNTSSLQRLQASQQNEQQLASREQLSSGGDNLEDLPGSELYESEDSPATRDSHQQPRQNSSHSIEVNPILRSDSLIKVEQLPNEPNLAQPLPRKKRTASVGSLALATVYSDPNKALPPLEVQALYLSRPLEFIETLAPQQLLQELLGRMLNSGISRLYLERQPEQGRILWSENGVLQSVLERLTLPIFQGVIIELKRLLNLPLLTVTAFKQVEIECRYQQECLLLRLRVNPGSYGEEATFQIVRGVALKLYQRQKLEKLSQDALQLGGQLQRKLKEIRNRSSRHGIPLEMLPALNQLMQGLTKQLEALADLQTTQDE
ncbi:hypothetical protein [Lyngbya aestuarii]|uniref:hypothetical protein n=1 Tax=Lyngbya aestuarii TaxID=118322 RepID=UPI00403D992D